LLSSAPPLLCSNSPPPGSCRPSFSSRCIDALKKGFTLHLLCVVNFNVTISSQASSR
jgi:hypothetical protein